MLPRKHTRDALFLMVLAAGALGTFAWIVLDAFGVCR